MNRILLFDPDVEFAERLQATLQPLGDYQVTHVLTTVEACLMLTNQRQDLAFIPANPEGQPIYSLRALQPDLRLVVTTPSSDYDLPSVYSGRVQGVLIKPLVEVDLPAVLAAVEGQVLPRPKESPVSATDTHHLDTAVIIAALQEADLGQLVQTAVLAHGPSLLGYWGELNDAEATTVVRHVGEGWENEKYRSQLQFIHLPARTGDWLLYTRSVDGSYLLTLVALPETPVSQLRQRADRLADALRDVLHGKPAPLDPDDTRLDERCTYAIAWQSTEALPQALFIPLRRIIERLAEANGCILTHVEVRAALVHLVVNCPPERNSSWAAYLFKRGAEEAIQREYGISLDLWETGFYAAETADPLSEAELNLFLERNRA